MRKFTLGVCVAALLTAGAASAQETVKMGYIDPLSGGGASVGEVGLKHYQWLADQINAQGGLLGKKLEILPLDNKTNPQESVVQAQKAIDAGARFITQGNGSSVAGIGAQSVHSLCGERDEPAGSQDGSRRRQLRLEILRRAVRIDCHARSVEWAQAVAGVVTAHRRHP